MRLVKLFLFLCLFSAFTIPKPVGFVNDYAEIIEKSKEREINSLALKLKEEGIAEIAVLTVKNIEGGDIFAYSQAVFDSWKVGKKGKDNGILFVLSVQDKKVRIHTGYGIEEVLPDGLVGEIIDNYGLPSFKKAEYGAGIYETLLAIAKVLKGEPVEPKKRKKKEPSFPIIAIIIFIILIRIIAGGRGRGVRFYYVGGGGFSGGGFGGGGFGGFGGGSSGGGGAGRSW